MDRETDFQGIPDFFFDLVGRSCYELQLNDV